MKGNSLPQQDVNQWLNSLSSLLGEISSIEISTTIVEEIEPEVFLPYEAYQRIYQISPDSLVESGIHPTLCDRYITLRRQLELQYALLTIDSNSNLFNPSLAPEIRHDLPVLASSVTTWESMPCRLPPPANQPNHQDDEQLANLLREPNFINILRQLAEKKTALNQRNQRLLAAENSELMPLAATTYVQTSIQLDGKINNRYASRIIDHPQQKQIMELHQQGIEASEKQWHKLLRFVVEIVQRQQQKFWKSSSTLD